MNYEQKYKEALETVQEILSSGADAIRTKTLKLRLQSVFPELAESKDERIRKELIEHIKANYEADYVLFKKFSPDDVIAWLEKQGKQKSSLPKWKYKKDNTPLLRDSLVLNKYGCVLKALSGAIISDAWVLDYTELAELPREEPEKQGKMLDADKVIEWLDEHVPTKFEDMQNYVENFRKAMNKD